MSLYRSFLWWLLLAALGALAWQLLQPDLGEVIIRWHGTTLTTTMAFFLLASILFLVTLWLLWTAFRFPYHAWQNYAQKQARGRLNSGLTAFYEGRYSRAQRLLMKAADDKNVRDLALLGARQAAIAQEDWVAAAQLLERLNLSNPNLAASNNARALLKQGKAKPALDVLMSRPTTEWSPIARGIAIEAAVSLQQFDLAHNWLSARDNGLSTKQQEQLNALYQQNYLSHAESADILWKRWQELSGHNKASTTMAEAFATRALALGMSGSAAESLIESLESHYDAASTRALAVLSHNDKTLLDRIAALVPMHSTDADLQHTLGAWSKACGNASDAIAHWQRAIAQGGGAESWNQLGLAFAEQGQFEQAYIAENNARRVLNGEALLPMSGITLRQKIAAEAVSEQRNEHGIPWLPH